MATADLDDGPIPKPASDGSLKKCATGSASAFYIRRGAGSSALAKPVAHEKVVLQNVGSLRPCRSLPTQFAVCYCLDARRWRAVGTL
jgi:hypothetical protein